MSDPEHLALHRTTECLRTLVEDMGLAADSPLRRIAADADDALLRIEVELAIAAAEAHAVNARDDDELNAALDELADLRRRAHRRRGRGGAALGDIRSTTDALFAVAQELVVGSA